MRFSAPKAPNFFRDLTINKNPPLVNENLSKRGGGYKKNSTDEFSPKNGGIIYTCGGKTLWLLEKDLEKIEQKSKTI